jgi:hypothetical protein
LTNFLNIDQLGTVMFGNDGSLFGDTDDDSHLNGVDSRALRALSWDGLSGKVLRINPITGAGYADR